jgi:hypothetical protein
MKKTILNIVMFGLVAAAVALAPTQGFAQEDKKKDSTEKKDAPKGEKKRGDGLPIRGKLAAVDKAAKTVKIGESTYQVTADTRIMKAGKAATLDDATVGEEVGGYYKETDGKKVLASLRIGPRPEGEGKGGEKKKKKED